MYSGYICSKLRNYKKKTNIFYQCIVDTFVESYVLIYIAAVYDENFSRSLVGLLSHHCTHTNRILFLVKSHGI